MDSCRSHVLFAATATPEWNSWHGIFLTDPSAADHHSEYSDASLAPAVNITILDTDHRWRLHVHEGIPPGSPSPAHPSSHIHQRYTARTGDHHHQHREEHFQANYIRLCKILCKTVTIAMSPEQDYHLQRVEFFTFIRISVTDP